MKSPRAKFNLRRMMVATIKVVAWIGLVPLLWGLATLDPISDGYALWGAADMVEDFMEDHAGEWPRCWADLEPYFDAGGGRVGGWSFEKYQRRVRIDFGADVKRLVAQAKASDDATFRVIWAAHPMSSMMGGRDPNELLHSYLKNRCPR